MPPLAFALVTAVTWGFADTIAAMLSRRHAVIVVAAGVQGAGIVGAVAYLAIARDAVPARHVLVAALVAGSVSALGLLVFYQALATGRATVVAPVASTGIVVPVVVGLARGERPSAMVAAGLVATAIGVVVVLATAGGGHDEVRGNRASVVWAVMAAAFFGAFMLATDARGDGSLPWFLVLARTVATVPAAALVLARRMERPPARSRVGLLLLFVGLLDAGAWATSALALGGGDLATVSVVIALYPVFTVLFAAVLLHERLRRIEVAGAGLALAGVALIAGG